MTDNYNILITKLDSFIRKYYKNQIIRGGIYTTAALLIFFLIITLIEYFGWFNSATRTVFFYLYLIISVLIIINFVFIPITKLLKIGKILSHKKAAEIIGKHFPNVQDKLLNTLQLNDLSKLSQDNTGLINASIDQKVATLRPIPFSNAVDFRGNKKYLKFAVIPVIILLSFLLTSPGIITEPTTRIINHNNFYEKAAPYKFNILNESLEAVQQEDFTVEMKIEGETVPENVTIFNGEIPMKMKKNSNTSFSYTFRNLQKDVSFRFETEELTSEFFTIQVKPKPILLSFETEINYPNYTGKKDEIIENTGDIIIPEGTIVTWKFFTRDTKQLNFKLSDSVFFLSNSASNVFVFQSRLLKSTSYSVSMQNEYLKNNDSLLFAISVIPDAFPIISLEEFTDSTLSDMIYFRGIIKDDYGFNKLHFNFKKSQDKDNLNKEFQFENIEFKSNINQQQFFYTFDLSIFNLVPGDQIEYYFEVWDNDEINGSKSSKSQQMIFKAPSIEEIEEKTEAANERIKDDLEGALKDLHLLQQDINDLNKKLYDKKSLSWQEKQQIELLLDRQKSIEERLENLQQTNEEKLNNEQKYKEIDEDLIQKQNELQKLMDEFLTDEMKKMMEEIQKLLDELDKDKVSEMMKEMKMNSEELEDQLDRSLELFKQLEFEQQLQETIDKLKDLAEEQQKLSEETKNDRQNDDTSNEGLKEKQDELNKKFDDLRKDMDDIERKNSELESPNDLENTDKEEQEINDLMQESSEDISKQQNQKASQKQKGASQKMEQLSQKLQQMMDSMQMEQMGEDINTLRGILENLIQVSFDQEALMNKYSELNPNDPKYVASIETQKNLKDDIDMIADSLKALSKRQMMIQPFVNKELKIINRNIDDALQFMESRTKGRVVENQQYVMTSVNNLALLLGESLEQMQQQMMQMSGSGKSSCSKPGKPGAGQQMNSMKNLQEQLNKQLQQLRDGQKPGEKMGKNQQMSEQLARMAAQQAAIRKQMESLRDQIKEEGRGVNGDIAKMIEDMEKTEKDIVNRKITQETLKRQEDILTRLLKSEKAERQREEEQRRESREAKDQKISNPDKLFDFYQIKSRELELLQTVPPNLNPFYKNKVSEYFYRFN